VCYNIVYKEKGYKMPLMNKEEALKFFEGVELTFSNYYKFVFTYEGEKDGNLITVDYGGCDIYRDEFGPTQKFWNIGFGYFKVIESGKDGKPVYQFYEN
jgi:hypothetical protein